MVLSVVAKERLPEYFFLLLFLNTVITLILGFSSLFFISCFLLSGLLLCLEIIHSCSNAVVPWRREESADLRRLLAVDWKLRDGVDVRDFLFRPCPNFCFFYFCVRNYTALTMCKLKWTRRCVCRGQLGREVSRGGRYIERFGWSASHTKLTWPLTS